MAVDRLPHVDDDDAKRASDEDRKVIAGWEKMRKRLSELEKRCASPPPRAKASTAVPALVTGR